MKQKSFEMLLYSAGGIVAMAVLLVAINLIASEFPARADLTQEKIYTLSPGTRAILGKLDTPVTIRFYCTRNVTPTAESLYLQNYARQVEDLLDEYQQAAHGKIVIQKFDPEPDSDAEDSARLDGIEPETLPTGDKFYLGLAVSLLDAKQTVALVARPPAAAGIRHFARHLAGDASAKAGGGRDEFAARVRPAGQSHDAAGRASRHAAVGTHQRTERRLHAPAGAAGHG